MSAARRAILLLLLLSTTHLCACSFLAQTHQKVEIQTNIASAKIFVDGDLVGQGVARPFLDRGRSHRVEARHNKRRVTAYIGQKISPAGILDLAGGVLFLVHFIGLLAPGFWELEPGELVLSLPQKELPKTK